MSEGIRVRNRNDKKVYQAQVEGPRHPGTGDRRRNARSFDSLREAKEWRATELTKVATDANRLTLNAYLLDWLKGLKLAIRLGDLRPNTFAWYEGAVRVHIAPGLGAVLLERLTPAQIEEFYAERLAAGVSRSNLRRIHVTLRKALASAVKRRMILRNVANELDHGPSVPKPQRTAQTRVWTSDQIRTFLSHTSEHRLASAFRFTAVTGARRGEVLGLQWADVNLDSGYVDLVRTWVMVGGGPQVSDLKTDRTRRVHFDVGTAAALRAWRKQQTEERLRWGAGWQDTGFIFTRENGTPIRPDWFTRTFRRLSIEAGLPRMTPHGLRHSAATFHLEAGTPVAVVAEMLGHSSTRITQDVYSHVLPSLHKHAVDKLGAALRART